MADRPRVLERMIGDRVSWTRPDGVKVCGVVIATRPSHSVVITPEGDFAGVQFQLHCDDGCRVWTCTFADASKPVKDWLDV